MRPIAARRVFAWLAVAAVAAVAALLGVLRGQAGPMTTLAAAQFQLECAGPGASVQAVALPDLWERRGLGGCMHARYRLQLPAAGAEPLWIFVPKVRMNAEFWLNGTLVWSGGRMEPPITRHSTTPFFFMLPPALMRGSGNELLVRVAALPGARGGLSVVHAGTHDALWPEVSSRRFWQNYGVYATSAVVAATSLYILMTWLQSGRRARSDLYLAICGAIWALRNLNLIWIDFPGGSLLVREIAEFLAFSGHGWFMGFFGLFLLARYSSALPARGARAMRATIIASMLLGPVLQSVVGNRGSALTLWLILASPVILAMAAILLREAWRERTSTAIGFVAAFFALVGIGAYDNMLMVRASHFGSVYMTPYAGVVLFVAIAQMLVARYGRLLREHELLNLSLERQLSQREAQLQSNYTALQHAERERAALEERARIMRDLHDGVGSMLLSTMHDVRRGVERAELQRLLQSCLDDLRLAVDSLEPHSNYPSTILGSLRYRLAPRLAEAGIRLRWEVDEVPPLAELDPSRTLQLLRLLQEAIANVIRHARATELAIGLHRTEDGVEIVVQDNGVGFEPAEAPRGHGLANMRHRAARMDASLSIESGTGGTTLRLRLLVVEEAPDLIESPVTTEESAVPLAGRKA